jgi:hypothetical protein
MSYPCAANGSLDTNTFGVKLPAFFRAKIVMQQIMDVFANGNSAWLNDPVSAKRENLARIQHRGRGSPDRSYRFIKDGSPV